MITGICALLYVVALLMWIGYVLALAVIGMAFIGVLLCAIIGFRILKR